jgi:hypothetical protein
MLCHVLCLMSLFALAFCQDLQGSWHRADFPSPRTDAAKCGRPDVQVSYVCDPARMLKTDEGMNIIIKKCIF